MRFSLAELRKHSGTPLVFEETLAVEKNLLLRASEILEISPVKVQGALAAQRAEYLLNYKIEFVITLPSTRSLTPVKLPMKLEISEIFMTTEQIEKNSDFVDETEVLLIEEDENIDLQKSIEDNILLNIPSQVLSEEEEADDIYPSGDDWEVMSEEEYATKVSLQGKDSHFEKLKNFFD